MSVELNHQNAALGDHNKLPFDHNSNPTTTSNGPASISNYSEDNSKNSKDKKAGKSGIRLSTIAAAPFNGLAHMLGGQSFLPMDMDKECDKASKILQEFCSKWLPTKSAKRHANSFA